MSVARVLRDDETAVKTADLLVIHEWVEAFKQDNEMWWSGSTTEEQDAAAKVAWRSLVAVLPEPEWEPSDELVERLCGEVVHLEDHDVWKGCADAIQLAKRLRAAGLLRDDL